MKLRNKQSPNKFGKIVPYDAGKGSGIAVKTDQGVVWYYHSLAELNSEWEDYEEPKEYCFVSEFGKVYSLKNIPMDKERIGWLKQIGNYFETKEEAKKAVEKLKAWKRLKDKGFRFSHHSFLDRRISYKVPMADEKIGKDLDLLFGGEE